MADLVKKSLKLQYIVIISCCVFFFRFSVLIIEQKVIHYGGHVKN